MFEDKKSDKKLNSWQQMPFKQKMQLIDYWTVIIVISNLIHLFGVILEIQPDDEVISSYKNNLIGMGTFLIWLSLTKYLQYNKELFILPATFTNSAGIIFQ